MVQIAENLQDGVGDGGVGVVVVGGAVVGGGGVDPHFSGGGSITHRLNPPTGGLEPRQHFL